MINWVDYEQWRLQKICREGAATTGPREILGWEGAHRNPKAVTEFRGFRHVVARRLGEINLKF